jgi:hypothetical protein
MNRVRARFSRLSGFPFTRFHLSLSLLALLFASFSISHAGSQISAIQPGQRTQGPFEAPSDIDPITAARRLKALNVERQKTMVSDAGKLVQLARELNAEINQAQPSSLTPVQLRKIADIERLARSVKQKMSFSIVDEVQFQPFPASMP